MKQPNWTDAEIEELESMAGNIPFQKLVESYNNWSYRNGFPYRSDFAILSLASRRGIRRRVEGEWVTSGYIASVLGVNISTPQRWFEKRHIRCYHNFGRRRGTNYFKRSDILAMARRHPDLLGGVERDRLFALLEDADLADSISSRYPARKGSGRPIQVVETGETFPSVRAAAKAFYVCPQSIYSSMRNNGKCAGYHWRHVNP